jgi:hypothetical protein
VFHLREEFPLAGALGRQVQAQIGLLHGSDCKHVARQVMQTFPGQGNQVHRSRLFFHMSS